MGLFVPFPLCRRFAGEGERGVGVSAQVGRTPLSIHSCLLSIPDGLRTVTAASFLRHERAAPGPPNNVVLYDHEPHMMHVRCAGSGQVHRAVCEDDRTSRACSEVPASKWQSQCQLPPSADLTGTPRVAVFKASIRATHDTASDTNRLSRLLHAILSLHCAMRPHAASCTCQQCAAHPSGTRSGTCAASLMYTIACLRTHDATHTCAARREALRSRAASPHTVQ